MIELFDASRLEPRRDYSLAAAAAALALGAGALSVYAGSLQDRVRQAEARSTELQAQMRQLQARGGPTPSLVQDLQRQALLVEAELAQGGSAPEAATLAASQWLDRLAALGRPEVSLSRVEVDRAGAARIEGQAVSPSAVSAFVQSWGSQDQLAGVPARALEVRQDKTDAPTLRFMLQAHTPGRAAAHPGGSS